jgi:Uma2 family endonuclease
MLKLGPADHGRAVTAEEFESADYERGYRYELIRGRLYVSPVPNAPHDFLKTWLYNNLFLYARDHPAVINYLTTHPRVFLPEEPEKTRPEPDLGAYRDYPLGTPVEERDWRDLEPILVAEVLSQDDPDKDLVRNVELYLEVPSIREYWIIDPRESYNLPALVVYRRRGRRWQKPIEVPGGGTYTTRLLPGFSLLLDAHR